MVNPTVTSIIISTPVASITLGQSQSWQAITGAQGLGGPNINVLDRTAPGIDGSLEPLGDPWEVLPLEVSMPVHVEASSPEELDLRMGELRRVLRSRYAGGANPAATTLTFVRSDGTTRSLDGYRRVDADWTPANARELSRVVTVELTCPNPWPYGPLEEVVYDTDSLSASATLPVSIGTPPIFRLARQGGFGSLQTIAVGGEVETFPTIRVLSGPLDSLSMTRVDGREWELTATLGEFEEAVINTDKRVAAAGNPRVTVNGIPAWGSLTKRDLFPLRPGTDDITFTVTGATSATQVQLEWFPRWEVMF